MKISNTGFIMKGIAFAVSGATIIFFPNIITWLFYLIGGIIAFGSLMTLFTAISKGTENVMLGGSIVGIIIGGLIICLPRFITIEIPFIAGIVFGIMGIVRLINGISGSGGQNVRTLKIVSGVLMLGGGIFFIFNPFKAAALIRIIIGAILILFSLYYFYAAHIVSQRNKNSNSNIIDV